MPVVVKLKGAAVEISGAGGVATDEPSDGTADGVEIV